MPVLPHDRETLAGVRSPTAEDRWVVPLGSVARDQTWLVGGKAASLAALLRAGLPVPDGFCITTAAFEHHLASIPRWAERRAALTRILSAPRTPDLPGRAGFPAGVEPDPVTRLGEELRVALAETAVPLALAQAICVAWQALGTHGTYAVRSSATVEDAAGHSFAGQFDSFLNVRGEAALFRAVQACWQSLFSDRALAYFRRQRIPLTGVGMAVIVQRMVPAERAGVLFTADPLTGDAKRCVIEYVPGLGDSLVSGRVQPRRLVLDKVSARILEASGPDGTPGTALADDFRQRLGSLAGETERLFGAPQDIEWAQDQGQIYLLQSRPLTVLPSPSPSPAIIWSNLNVAENFPEVATPLTWSMLEFCLHGAFAPVFRALGIDPRRTPWVGLVAGRVYMNVGTLHRLMRHLPGFRHAPMTRTFGGFQDDLEGPLRALGAEPGPGWRERWRIRFGLARLATWFLWRASWRGSARCAARFRSLVEELTGTDIAALPEAELLPHLDRLWARLLARVPIPVNLGAGILSHVALEWACTRWFGDRQGVLVNRLLSRTGAMASAASALDLWHLAGWVNGQPELHRTVAAASSFAGASAQLQSSAEGRAFLQRWEAFLRAHGHHAAGEPDVATPRWSETPDLVLRMLQHYLENHAQLDLDRVLAERTRQRDLALTTCRRQLRGPFRGFLLGLLVRTAQTWLLGREHLKCEFVRVLAHGRQVFLELGRRLTRNGRLERPEDVFFLTLEELEPVRTGSVPWNVPQRIRERRAEHARNQALHPPPVVVGSFTPEGPCPQSTPFDANTRVLTGLPVSPGFVRGPARVILKADEGEPVLPGEILVAPATDPGWTPLLLTAAGVVVDLGGQLSHGSVIAREYGLPAVVNVRFGTRLIRTGQPLEVDADRGVVRLLD
ncbi:MAG: hypothetical protein HS113_15690 [Verrucomicrobiales bacterium]|nr:hypothetical protein [Verrucomicrobiales bacterium]